jgi:hypothetical protein
VHCAHGRNSSNVGAGAVEVKGIDLPKMRKQSTLKMACCLDRACFVVSHDYHAQSVLGRPSRHEQMLLPGTLLLLEVSERWSPRGVESLPVPSLSTSTSWIGSAPARFSAYVQLHVRFNC